MQSRLSKVLGIWALCDITDLPVQLLDVSKSVSKSSGINFEDWSGKPDDANKKKSAKENMFRTTFILQYCNSKHIIYT